MDGSEAKTAAIKINSALKLELAFEDLCGAWENYIEVWKKERSHLKEILGQIQNAEARLPISQDMYFATAFLLSRITVFWDRDKAIKKFMPKTQDEGNEDGIVKDASYRGIVVFLRNYTQHVGTLRGHISSNTLKREGYMQEEWAGIGVLIGELPEHDQVFEDRNLSIIEDYKGENPDWETCNVSMELDREFNRILEHYPESSFNADEIAEREKGHLTHQEEQEGLVTRALDNNSERLKLQAKNHRILTNYTYTAPPQIQFDKAEG